jgi:hypothetical protein
MFHFEFLNNLGEMKMKKLSYLLLVAIVAAPIARAEDCQNPEQKRVNVGGATAMTTFALGAAAVMAPAIAVAGVLAGGYIALNEKPSKEEADKNTLARIQRGMDEGVEGAGCKVAELAGGALNLLNKGESKAKEDGGKVIEKTKELAKDGVQKGEGLVKDGEALVKREYASVKKVMETPTTVDAAPYAFSHSAD